MCEGEKHIITPSDSPSPETFNLQEANLQSPADNSTSLGAKLPHSRALAFLGDAVFELRVREWAVARGIEQSRALHGFATRRVRAETQAALLHALQDQGILSKAELEIIRQGRNLGVGAGKRMAQSDYRQATGLEALIGALHLADQPRLEALWTGIAPILDALSEESKEGESEP